MNNIIKDITNKIYKINTPHDILNIKNEITKNNLSYIQILYLIEKLERKLKKITKKIIDDININFNNIDDFNLHKYYYLLEGSLDINFMRDNEYRKIIAANMILINEKLNIYQ